MSTQTPSDAPDPDALVAPAPPRMALGKALPEFYRAMIALDGAAVAGLDPVIAELVRYRSSQINGCAYCMDIHARDARKRGVSQQQLDCIAAWAETSLFSARQRAALALAEAVTRISDHGVADSVYDAAAQHFDGAELAHLLAMAITINAWNRIAISTRTATPHRHE